MSRERLLEAILTQARGLGWTELIIDDLGSTVQLLVSAPGATEQMVEGPPHKLPGLLKVLGGPEDYPAIEEYDPGLISISKPERDPEDYVEKADPTPAAELASELAEIDAYNAKIGKFTSADGYWLVKWVDLNRGPQEVECHDLGQAYATAELQRAAAYNEKYAATVHIEAH
jgi:hypothetical protein